MSNKLWFKLEKAKKWFDKILKLVFASEILANQFLKTIKRSLLRICMNQVITETNLFNNTQLAINSL